MKLPEIDITELNRQFIAYLFQEDLLLSAIRKNALEKVSGGTLLLQDLIYDETPRIPESSSKNSC